MIDFEYTFEPSGAGCRFTRRLDYEVRGPLRILAPLLRRANERLAELGAAPIDFVIGDESGSGDKRSPPPPTRRRGLWAFISGGDADDVDSGYDSPAR